jgi:hypothetical protein
MKPTVFISYSSKDKPIADAVCATLEREKVKCWIAPRDILPGQKYGTAIIDAIFDSKLFVLIFSKNANNSNHIRIELERAVSSGSIIIPFKIEDVIPNKDLLYGLSDTQWLDAMTPPIQNHISYLVSTIKSIISDRNVSVIQSANSSTLNEAKAFEIAWLILLTVAKNIDVIIAIERIKIYLKDFGIVLDAPIDIYLIANDNGTSVMELARIIGGQLMAIDKNAALYFQIAFNLMLDIAQGAGTKIQHIVAPLNLPIELTNQRENNYEWVNEIHKYVCRDLYK